MSTAEAFTVTRYRCPHCRRSYANRKRADVHIAVCWYNQGCMTCRHVEQAYGGNYVTGCELGEDLTEPDTSYGGQPRIIPRGSCPLWEAP